MYIKPNLPLEPSVFFHEFIEVCHELIDSFSHVHVSHSRPYCICLGESGYFIFIRAKRRLELITGNTGLVRSSPLHYRQKRTCILFHLLLAIGRYT